MIPPEAQRLCVYLNAHEYWHGQPLYQAVVETARALHLAGASVFPVKLSYGAHHRLHDAASEYTSFEIPVVVEVVEGPAHVESLLHALGSRVGEGLATIEPIRVFRSARAKGRGMDAPSETPEDRPSLRDQSSPMRSATPMRIEGAAQWVTFTSAAPIPGTAAA